MPRKPKIQHLRSKTRIKYTPSAAKGPYEEYIQSIQESTVDRYYNKYLGPKGSRDGSPVSNTGVKVDYCTITWREDFNDGNNEEWNRLAYLLIMTIGMCPSPYPEDIRPRFNFDKAVKVGESGAYLAWGGKSQRGWIMLKIPGHAIEQVQDRGYMSRLVEFCKHKNGRLTRVDVRHDDYEGKRSVDWALRKYRKGAYNSKGRPPSYNQQGQWDKVNEQGRTLYIGSRHSTKMVRVYEKGKQLGDPKSKWVRHEVEFKRSKEYEIPLEILENPEEFLAGSYEVYSFITEVAKKIVAVGVEAGMTVDKAIKEASRSAGKLINVLIEQLDMTSDEVVKALRRDGAPKRLLPIMSEYWPEQRLRLHT